jgi:hypothetical protein
VERIIQQRSVGTAFSILSVIIEISNEVPAPLRIHDAICAHIVFKNIGGSYLSSRDSREVRGIGANFSLMNWKSIDLRLETH